MANHYHNSGKTDRLRSETSELALYGGKPVRERLLPYGRHSVTPEDIQAVVDVLQGDWLTTGPRIAEFEETVAECVGARYAVAFSSGTAALHAAVFAADLGPGDEAITSPLTFAATANCVLYQGATLVFADIEGDTLTLDPDQVNACLTQKTRAILPVDYAGHPAELDALLELAERHGLIVIEDACHALGAIYKGRRVGSISHMTAYSFHPVKHITTGEGGMITTNNAHLAERLRRFRTHGIDYTPSERANSPWYYQMIDLGFNYRITDIGCALGTSQLQRLSTNLACRREIVRRYNDAFTNLDAVIAPTERADVESAWHIYPIQVDAYYLTTDRAEIFRALRAENIGVNVHYIPVHLHPYYQKRFGYRGGEYPVAEKIYEQLITLPIFSGMSEQDVEDVIKAVNKVMGYYAY